MMSKLRSSCDTLIFIPTQRELKLCAVDSSLTDRVRIELCGFGAIPAAARTAKLLADLQPSRAILLGIAGCFDDVLQVGAAYQFQQVACHGIGVGSGCEFQSASSLGWPLVENGGEDILTLVTDAAIGPAHTAGLLLSGCSASANQDEARRRRAQFPGAVAEDMEGFAVAWPCRQAQVPLCIVRGIANQVGDRDHSRWQVNVAMQSAVKLVLLLVAKRYLPSVT